MTCLEKLRKLNPDWDETKINKYIEECCPRHMYIAHDPIWCMKTYECEKCWNRTLKEYDGCNDYEFSVTLNGDDMRMLARLCDGAEKRRNDVISAALWCLEQSLLCDPGMDMEVCENESSKEV